MYKEIFDLEIDQHNNWVPHIICNCCKKMLYRWKREKNREYIKYSIPAIWKYPRSEEDCFFCSNQMKGFNIKNKDKIVYISVASVTAPILAEKKECKTDFGCVSGGIEAMEIDEESAEEYCLVTRRNNNLIKLKVRDIKK